jgi:hypothetical protein
MRLRSLRSHPSHPSLPSLPSHRSRRTLAAGLLAAVLAGGCGAPHPGVSNGSVSVCYRAIPTALAAVHDTHARLIGVHRIPEDSVRSRLPAYVRARMQADNDTEVCVVAFKGDFTPGQVELAPPTEQGSYAVLLVTSRNLRLVGGAVLDHLPGSLGKRTL